MLISSGMSTLTNTLRNNVFPAIEESVSPVKLTHKINRHKYTHIYGFYLVFLVEGMLFEVNLMFLYMI